MRRVLLVLTTALALAPAPAAAQNGTSPAELRREASLALVACAGQTTGGEVLKRRTAQSFLRGQCDTAVDRLAALVRTAAPAPSADTSLVVPGVRRGNGAGGRVFCPDCRRLISAYVGLGDWWSAELAPLEARADALERAAGNDRPYHRPAALAAAAEALGWSRRRPPAERGLARELRRLGFRVRVAPGAMAAAVRRTGRGRPPAVRRALAAVPRARGLDLATLLRAPAPLAERRAQVATLRLVDLRAITDVAIVLPRALDEACTAADATARRAALRRLSDELETVGSPRLRDVLQAAVRELRVDADPYATPCPSERTRPR